MNIKNCLLCCTLLLLNFAEARGQESGNWFANDTTRRLEEVIIAFRANYEQVHSQRHAFYCQGTLTRKPGTSVLFQEVNFLGLFDARDVQFHANSWVGDTTRQTFDLEQWDQRLNYQSKLYQRWGPFNGEKRETLEDEEKIKDAVSSFVRFDPIDMALSADGNAYLRGPGPQADRSLTAGKLVEAKFLDNGDIVHTVDITKKDSPYQIRIVYRWAKQLDYYPIGTEYLLITGDGNSKQIKPVSHVITDWQNVGTLKVPKSLTIISRRKQQQNQQMELDVVYSFEPELPVGPLITPEMDDWREPLRVLFKANWDRRSNGQISSFNAERN